MRIEVRYQTPYNACEWRSQWFPTLAEAERMVDFYRNHYLAAALLMIVAIGFPMMCAALGMKVNTRNGWWD